MKEFLNLFSFVRVVSVILLFSSLKKIVECFNLCQFKVLDEKTNKFLYFDFSRASVLNFELDYPFFDEHPLTAYFSFCGERETLSCGKEDFICIKNSSSHGNEYFGAGSKLESCNYDNSIQAVIVKLTGGIMCKEGKNFSSSIYLQCEKYEQSPVFSFINDCELLFNWFTNDACGIEKPALGVPELCFVDEDFIRFDLQPLQHLNYYSVPSTAELNYEINICGPIKNGSCAGEQTYLCEVHSNGTILPIDVGRVNYNFNSSSLKLTAVYESSKMPNNNVASIEFVCGKNVGHEEIRYLRTESSVPIFEIKTESACVPFIENCSFNDGSTFYDFSSLLKHNNSWEVIDPSGNQYYFSMCGLLLSPFNHYNLKDDRVLAFMWNAKNNSIVKLGSKIVQPKIDLKFVYFGGSQCATNNAGHEAHRLHLELVCSKGENKPVFKNVSACQHFIELHTPAACPIKDNCSLLNNDSLLRYNIFPLIGDEFKICDGTDEFVIDICEKVLLIKNVDCHLQNHSTNNKERNEIINLGYVNPAKLVSSQNILLRYDKGDICPHDSNLKLSSLINVVCDSSAGKGQAVFDYYSEHFCQYNFTWRTNNICSYPKLGNIPIKNCLLIYNDTDSGIQFINMSLSIKNHKSIFKSGEGYTTNLCNIYKSICPKGIVCNINQEYWFFRDQFNKIQLNFAPDSVAYYNYRENCNENRLQDKSFYLKNTIDISDHYQATLDQLYCGEVPPGFRLKYSNKREIKCAVKLEDFNFKPCSEKSKVEGEKWSFSIVNFLLVVGAFIMLCLILLILRCPKLRFRCFGRSSMPGPRGRVRYGRQVSWHFNKNL